MHRATAQEIAMFSRAQYNGLDPNYVNTHFDTLTIGEGFIAYKVHMEKNCVFIKYLCGTSIPSLIEWFCNAFGNFSQYCYAMPGSPISKALLTKGWNIDPSHIQGQGVLHVKNAAPSVTSYFLEWVKNNS